MENPFAAKPTAPEAPSPDAPPQPISMEIPGKESGNGISKEIEPKDDPPTPIPRGQVPVAARSGENGATVRVDVKAKPANVPGGSSVAVDARKVGEEKLHHGVLAEAPGHPIFQSAIDPSLDSAADEVVTSRGKEEIDSSSMGLPMDEEDASEGNGPSSDRPDVVSEVRSHSVARESGEEEGATPDEMPENRGDIPRNSHHSALPALGMDEISCRTCRFFEHSAENRSVAVKGECRCKAPTPGKGKVASWPTVQWRSWCGEWDLGVSDEEMVKMARAVADRITNGPSGGFLAQGGKGME